MATTHSGRRRSPEVDHSLEFWLLCATVTLIVLIAGLPVLMRLLEVRPA